MMKAVILKGFGSVDNFELAEVDTPIVTSNDILVKIKATAFNPIDYQMRQGSTESKLLKSPILGRELSGIVSQIGEQVTGFAVGDNITAYVGSLASNGTYAEFISIPQQLVAKTPASLSFAQATALPMVGMTALQCFQRANIPKEKPIFINGGAGGVGTLLIKLLLANGNNELITTAGNEDSKTQLISLGLNPDNIINYHEPAFFEKIQSKGVNGKFEYCIDLVGGKMSEVCANLLQVHGVYVDVTFLATEQARETLFDKATTIINVANFAYSLTGNSNDTAFYGSALNEIFNKINDSIISPIDINIIGNLSVETVQKGHRMMERNETKGKKLVMINE